MKTDHPVHLQTLHLSPLQLRNTSSADFSPEDKPPLDSGSHELYLGSVALKSSRKLRLSHGATQQPTSWFVSSTPPYLPTHKTFLGLPKAQLPCFRCTCMHVGYYRPICLCLCECSSVHVISAHGIYSLGALEMQVFPPLCFINGCCNSEFRSLVIYTE